MRDGQQSIVTDLEIEVSVIGGHYGRDGQESVG